MDKLAKCNEGLVCVLGAVTIITHRQQQQCAIKDNQQAVQWTPVTGGSTGQLERGGQNTQRKPFAEKCNKAIDKFRSSFYPPLPLALRKTTSNQTSNIFLLFLRPIAQAMEVY